MPRLRPCRSRCARARERHNGQHFYVSLFMHSSSLNNQVTDFCHSVPSFTANKQTLAFIHLDFPHDKVVQNERIILNVPPISDYVNSQRFHFILNEPIFKTGNRFSRSKSFNKSIIQHMQVKYNLLLFILQT